MLINEALRANPRGLAIRLFLSACLFLGAICLSWAADEVNAVKKPSQPQKFVYKDKGRRNPFTPLVSEDGRFVNLEPPEKKSDLVVDGVIYDPNGISCAVVNSVVVKVSDIIDGYQVLRIETNKVVFIKDGLKKEVLIKKEE